MNRWNRSIGMIALIRQTIINVVGNINETMIIRWRWWHLKGSRFTNIYHYIRIVDEEHLRCTTAYDFTFLFYKRGKYINKPIISLTRIRKRIICNESKAGGRTFCGRRMIAELWMIIAECMIVCLGWMHYTRCKSDCEICWQCGIGVGSRWTTIACAYKYSCYEYEHIGTIDIRYDTKALIDDCTTIVSTNTKRLRCICVDWG